MLETLEKFEGRSRAGMSASELRAVAGMLQETGAAPVLRSAFQHAQPAVWAHLVREINTQVRTLTGLWHGPLGC